MGRATLRLRRRLHYVAYPNSTESGICLNSRAEWAVLEYLRSDKSTPLAAAAAERNPSWMTRVWTRPGEQRLACFQAYYAGAPLGCVSHYSITSLASLRLSASWPTSIARSRHFIVAGSHAHWKSPHYQALPGFGKLGRKTDRVSSVPPSKIRRTLFSAKEAGSKFSRSRILRSATSAT